MIDVFQDSIMELGRKYQNLVVLNRDCEREIGLGEFRQYFGERCFNLGLGEANMVSASAGFAVRGNVPIIIGESAFLIGKAWEQVRNDIAYPNLNVKIVGFGVGFNKGQCGVGCQSFEDISLMRSLPNMKVIVPGSGREVLGAMERMMSDFGPTYLRISGHENAISGESVDFEFGKGVILREGSDVCMFACGKMVGRCMEAANMLESDGVSAMVVNLASVKPLDRELVVKCARGVGVCVSVEEHSVIGGLGAAVCEALEGEKRVVRIGMEDKFGESGKVEFLERKYGLDVEGIYERVKGVLA